MELPFLGFPVSESLAFLVSLLGMLLKTGPAIQLSSEFQAKECLSPRSHSTERGKHWQQLQALDLSNGKTPLPAYTLL